MAIDYSLILGEITSVERLAERALPERDERPAVLDVSPGGFPRMSANLHGRYGFALTVINGRNRFLELTSDEGDWEWNPREYTTVTFHMDKEADFQWSVPNMMTIVRRVLTTGAEDAAFQLNGDVLLLARFDKALVKHNRESWWSFYPGAEQLFPG